MKDRIADVISAFSHQGIHRTGTQVDVASADWLAGQVRIAGADPQLTTFTFDRCVPAAELSVGDQAIEAIPFYDCPVGSTSASGAVCEPGGEGDIAVLSASSLAEQNSINDLRNNDRHAALVVITPPNMPPRGIALANAERFRARSGIPVLQVGNEHAETLERAVRERSTATFTCNITEEPATGINVGTRLPGKAPDLSPLVVMTPRSGWWSCASERGGGLVSWLEIIRHFAREQPARDVIFTANTGHELGHTGYDVFVDAHPGLERDAHAWLHLGANFAAPEAPVRLQFSDDTLHDMTAAFAKQHGVAFDPVINRRPGGEARAVYDAGGRYVSIIGGNPLFHHPEDVWPSAVDLDKTERICRMLLNVAQRLSEV